MESVVEKNGRFALVRSELGFAWTMSANGERWYWHANEAQWTACPCAFPSPEQASTGFSDQSAPPTPSRLPRGFP